MITCRFFVRFMPGKPTPEATCADYRQKLPNHTPDQIRAEQQRDADELLRNGFGWNVNPRVHSYRCEIAADATVQFVSLASEPAPFMPPPPLAF